MAGVPIVIGKVCRRLALCLLVRHATRFTTAEYDPLQTERAYPLVTCRFRQVELGHVAALAVAGVGL